MTNNPASAIPFYVHPFPRNALGEDLIESRYNVPLPYGLATGYQAQVDGIRIRHAITHFHRSQHFEKQNDERQVSLSFNLFGAYTIFQHGITYPVHGNQHNLIYTQGYQNTFVNHHLRGESFEISFAPEQFIEMTRDGNPTLQQFLDQMQEDRPVVLSQQSIPIILELSRAIRTIIHCNYQGQLRKLFLFSKCMEILVLTAESIDQFRRQASGFKLSAGDRERIHAARNYLIERYQDPPSLTELARRVGLNEYKLKRGFQAEYQTSAFALLAEYRLDRSREVLRNSPSSIAAIAYDLGFSSPQHFSAAFKKKFGVPPSRCRG